MISLFVKKIWRLLYRCVLAGAFISSNVCLAASEKTNTEALGRRSKNSNPISGSALNGEFKSVLEKKSLQEQYEFFVLFLEFLKQKGVSFSAQEFFTAANLVKTLASVLVKEGQSDKAVEVIRSMLKVTNLPEQARNELIAYLQTLNPEKLPLHKLVNRLSDLPQDIQDKLSWKDALLMDVCKVALLGDYTNRKYEVERAFSQEKYDESFALAEALLRDLEKEEVYLDPCLMSFEKTSLLRLQAFSKFFQAKKEGRSILELMDLIGDACSREKEHNIAINEVITMMSRGEVQRSLELDRILFSDALQNSTVSLSHSIRELEALIGCGCYLKNSIACNGYFKLLEWYAKGADLKNLERLLKVGEKEFLRESSSYYPSYLFFLGVLSYQKGDYEGAIVALNESIKNASSNCCFLADIWECLGCSLLKQAQRVEAASQRNRYYADAAMFFLKAYKNWGRPEGSVAWFLCRALVQDRESCRHFMQKDALKLPFKERNMILNLYGLFFTAPEELHVYPFSLRKEKNILSCLQFKSALEPMTVYEEIFASLVSLITNASDVGESKQEVAGIREMLDFNTSNIPADNRVKVCNTLLGNSVLSIVEEVISFENTKKLEQSISDNQWPALIKEALQALLAIRTHDIAALSETNDPYISLALQCYHAYTNGQTVSCHPRLLQEASPLLRSYLFLIFSKMPNRFEENFVKLVKDPAFISDPYGDRLFFLTHPYFLGKDSFESLCESARDFPKKFTASAFDSIAYYLASFCAHSLEEKEEYLRKAVQTLENLPYGLGKEAKVACTRFVIRYALAEVLIVRGTDTTLSDATNLLEELKEEFFSETHPATMSWRLDDPDAFYQSGKRVGLLLAKCYSLREEKVAWVNHIVESAENTLLWGSRIARYFDGSLAEAIELGRTANFR